MGDSFQGTGTILLQRGTSNVPYRFQVTVASSSNKNDGALPYGSSVCSFKAYCYPVGKTPTTSTGLIVAKSLDGNELVTRLSWTTALSQGVYQLDFRVVASVNGSTLTPIRRQFEFGRVFLKERFR